MNATTTILRAALLFNLFLLTAGWGWGQTIFSENMGNPTSKTNVNSYTGFENYGTHTYTGTGDADVRNTSPSEEYTGASGDGNVMINSESKSFEISGINTTNYTNLVLTFGQRKGTKASNNELIVEVSPDGNNYSPLTYSRPTGSGTATWLLIEPTGLIPSVSNLRIRFRGTNNTEWRIDDVKLVGESAPTGPTLTVSPSSITGLGYMEGGSSTEKTFSVSGSNLDPASGNISVTAPANFQVSTDNITYDNSVNLPYSGGILSATDVYVRLNSGLSIATYTGDITIAGGGADEKTVSVEGIVTEYTESENPCFAVDFSDITTGNSTSTNGSSSQWGGNADFPTVVKTYQAGGAVRMGNKANPRTGSIESRALTEVSGDITVNIMVKGWINIEGGIKVSIDGQEQSL
ncbi:MAG: hypothetical protein PHO74_04660, partial [Weeksellaceae bacterium]|nr:hypothetical protein [Weeksellaceae bacterium]